MIVDLKRLRIADPWNSHFAQMSLAKEQAVIDFQRETQTQRMQRHLLREQIRDVRCEESWGLDLRFCPSEQLAHLFFSS